MDQETFKTMENVKATILRIILGSIVPSETIQWCNPGTPRLPTRSFSFPDQCPTANLLEEESSESLELHDYNPYSFPEESIARPRFYSEPISCEDVMAKAKHIMQNNYDSWEASSNNNFMDSWHNETLPDIQFLSSSDSLQLPHEEGSVNVALLGGDQRQVEEEISVFKMEEDTVNSPPSSQVKVEHALPCTAATSPPRGNRKVTKTPGKGKVQAKKPAKRHLKPRMKPNNCLHLHEFLHEKLDEKDKGIAWTCFDRKEFRLVDSEGVARSWGERKNKKGMTYEKMARSLRYYYKLGIMKKVPHKRLHFAFGISTVWKK